MSTQRPDVTDEDIGMRSFQIRKAKAAERAMERLRHGLGADWSQLSNSDIEELDWVLGELWAYIARTEWDDLHFGSLSMSDVWKVLTLGRDLRRHARPAVEALTEVRDLVAAKA